MLAALSFLLYGTVILLILAIMVAVPISWIMIIWRIVHPRSFKYLFYGA